MKRDLASLCLELLRIPSVTGDEGALADHLERLLRALGADIRRVRHCLVASKGVHPLALVGHIDTVPPHPNDAEPYLVQGWGESAELASAERGPSRSPQSIVVGRGASDMKGAVAVMLEVFGACLARGELPPVLVLYDQEEGPNAHNGLRLLLAQQAIPKHVQSALVMEPTDGVVQLGCVGGVQARFVFRGQSAHSARPWQGDNAIHKAAGLLTRLAALERRPVTVGGLVFYEVVSATLATGGRSRNVVPDEFVVAVNFRFAPDLPLAEKLAQVRTALTELAPTAELLIDDVAPAATVHRDGALVTALAGLPIAPKQAWTDVATLTEAGIDAVNFGPGGTDQAHQRGEWVAVDDLSHARDVLERLVREARAWT